MVGIDPEKIAAKIKQALIDHDPVGREQWYVDEKLVMDCDAEELFWVIEKTLIEELG